MLIMFRGQISCEIAEGNMWDLWNIDVLKRHLSENVHLECMCKFLRIRHRSLKNHLLTESDTDSKTRAEFNESQTEPVKILLDNAIAISINSSILPVQNIHDHKAKHATLPENFWQQTKHFSLLSVLSFHI